MRTGNLRVLPLLLAALTLCLTAFPASAAEQAQSATAATMQLMKTEGTVNVTNSSGRSLTKRDNMRLYNGYHVETKAKSYAWINLDSEKLIKLDAVSEAEVRKSGKALELLLSSGSFFFNVTSPLKEGETLNIRTATMVVGIRGTSGWFKAIDRWSTEIYVLEGTIQCNVSDPVTGQVKEATIQSGEMAVATAYPQDYEGDKCDIVQERFEPGDIDGFVLEELAQNPELCADIFEKSGLDVISAVEATQERREQDEQKMQEALDHIENQLAKQNNNVSTGPVWEQNGSVSNTPPGSKDDTGDSGSSGGGAPSGPISVKLTAPFSPAEVRANLNDPGVIEVVLAGAVMIDDGNLSVPPGKTLTILPGIEVQLPDGYSLMIEGDTGGVGLVNNYGKLRAADIINEGTFTNYESGIIETQRLTTASVFGNRGIIQGTVAHTGGTADITGGTVTQFTQTGGSAALYNNAIINTGVNISGNASFTMKDGTINGGVTVSNGGTFNMERGTVNGDISVDANSTFHGTGGTVNGNISVEVVPGPTENDNPTPGGDSQNGSSTPGGDSQNGSPTPGGGSQNGSLTPGGDGETVGGNGDSTLDGNGETDSGNDLQKDDPLPGEDGGAGGSLERDPDAG